MKWIMPKSNRLIHNGMIKLIEECGELATLLAKKINAGEECTHYYDGTAIKLEDEIGDVLACIWFVEEKLKLSQHDIHVRARAKYNSYLEWDKNDVVTNKT